MGAAPSVGAPATSACAADTVSSGVGAGVGASVGASGVGVGVGGWRVCGCGACVCCVSEGG